MADSEIFRSKDNGALFILPEGPNTKPQYLPCHDLEDITESNGSVTLIQCINERGEYETIGASVGAPEPTTTTLGTYIGKVADWIETVRCPFALYVMLSCGKKGVFENWDRAMLVQVLNVSGRTRSGLVRKDEDVAAMHTFDIEAAPGVTDFFRLTSAAQAIDAAVLGQLTSLRFSDDVACWDACGETQEPCERGIATTTATTAAAANVLISPEWAGTAGWAASAADPFAAGEDIADGILIKVGRNVTRILVVRGTTDATNPAEIAYSDDKGATWNLVDVGSTNGEYAIKKGALFALNAYEVYLVTDGGRIYKSEDAGVTWEVKEDANITASQYNYIHFTNSQVGYAVGTAGLVVKTIDSGKNWGQVGAAAGSSELYSVWALSRNRVWAGGSNGEMYYTDDGGDTWNLRVVGDTTAAVNDQAWWNDYYGYIANGEYVQFTINGGYSFENIDDTAGLFTADLVSVNPCTERAVYAASPGSGAPGEIVLSAI